MTEPPMIRGQHTAILESQPELLTAPGRTPLWVRLIRWVGPGWGRWLPIHITCGGAILIEIAAFTAVMLTGPHQPAAIAAPRPAPPSATVTSTTEPQPQLQPAPPPPPPFWLGTSTLPKAKPQPAPTPAPPPPATTVSTTTVTATPTTTEAPAGDDGDDCPSNANGSAPVKNPKCRQDH